METAFRGLEFECLEFGFSVQNFRSFDFTAWDPGVECFGVQSFRLESPEGFGCTEAPSCTQAALALYRFSKHIVDKQS